MCYIPRIMRQSLAIFTFSLLAATAAAQSPIEVGQPAPDFELKDSAGKTYRLSEYRGKQAVVLEFFRSGDW